MAEGLLARPVETCAPRRRSHANPPWDTKRLQLVDDRPRFQLVKDRPVFLPTSPEWFHLSSYDAPLVRDIRGLSICKKNANLKQTHNIEEIVTRPPPKLEGTGNPERYTTFDRANGHRLIPFKEFGHARERFKIYRQNSGTGRYRSAKTLRGFSETFNHLRTRTTGGRRNKHEMSTTLNSAVAKPTQRRVDVLLARGKCLRRSQNQPTGVYLNASNGKASPTGTGSDGTYGVSTLIAERWMQTLQKEPHNNLRNHRPRLRQLTQDTNLTTKTRPSS